MELQQHKKDERPRIPPLEPGAEAGHLHFFIGCRPITGQDMRAIMEQYLLCRSALFTGQRKTVRPAILPIGPSERSRRILRQGLIAGRELSVFIPSQHAADKFVKSLETLVLPNVLHLLPQPESACQIKTKAKHLAIDEVSEVTNFRSIHLQRPGKLLDRLRLAHVGLPVDQ